MPAIPTPGQRFLVSLSEDGVWYIDSGADTLRYWEFASNSVTVPAFPRASPDSRPPSYAAHSGNQMVMLDDRQHVLSYDVSVPAMPRLVWSKPAVAGWVRFDGSGSQLLIDGSGRDQARLLDAATGRERDRVALRQSAFASWNPTNRWLAYDQVEDPLVVSAVTPTADGSLSVTQTSYPPYEIRYGLPVYALIGNELPPPTPGR